MDIVFGNLFSILTVVGMLVFFIIVATRNELPFEMEFCYYRTAHRKKLWKKVLPLIFCISVVVIGIYYLICILGNISFLPIYNMFFVFELLVCVVFLLYQSMEAKGVMIVSLLVTLTVPCLTLVIGVTHICLDKYLTVLELLFLPLTYFMYRRYCHFWQRGDY